MGTRRLLLGALAAAFLVGVPLAILVSRTYRQGRALAPGNGGVVIRFPGEDWGRPTPFQFYPRGPGYIHMSYLFDTLVWKDEDGLEGLLALAWEVSPDGLSYTFELRPGIRWHDGRRLTARDVAFSADYLRRHRFGWTDMETIAGAEALDDLHVTLRLREPFAPFLNDVAGCFPVIPAHVWKDVEDPETFSGPASVTGSGPFRLEHYDKTQGTYAYVANEDYFLGPPKVDKIQYVACGDRLLSLRNGDIDAMLLFSRTLDAADAFFDHPRLEILEGPGDWVLKIVFNHQRPALGRAKTRRALALAVDHEEIARRIRHGHVLPGSPAFLPRTSPWRHPDIGGFETDLDEARRLLAEAGATGKRFTLLAAPDYVREAEYVADRAGEIGLSLTVKALAPSTLDAFLREGNFEIAIDGHGGLGGDPDVLRKQFCLSAPSGEGASVLRSGAFGYRNEALERLGEAQRAEADPRKRRALVFRMQEILARDLPSIALWHPRVYFVYDPAVFDGWFFTPGGIGIGIPLTENKLAFVERRRP